MNVLNVFSSVKFDLFHNKKRAINDACANIISI